LTLISAPAGYGKTTLVSQSLSNFGFSILRLGSGQVLDFGLDASSEIENPKSEIQNPRVAWLTIDQEDNDPTLFVSGLVAALQTINSTCGAAIQALLSSQMVPNLKPRRLISLLINDILETLPEPFGLVLDDLHLITEPAIYTALDYLLEHLPEQMRLVITTRVEPALPLARLRARGQLAEFRLADLRFTLDEITVLLNDQLHLNLSAAALERLETNTEGWPAGLRLVAASFDRLPPAERDRFKTSLAESNRYVFDFMAEEVLNRQEATTRAFLLESSILSELNPALCQAVTGQAQAAAILEDLYRRNLFIVAVNDLRQPTSLAYRYHALFATFLRQQLAREQPAETLAALHRRAADAETVPARAIEHYFAAGAWVEAAQRIEQVAETFFSQGLLDRLSAWIQAIPSEVRETRPWLLYFLGVCAWGQGQFGQAQRLLQQALAGFEAAGDSWGRGAVLPQLSIIYQSSGNFAPAPDLARQALACPMAPRSQTQLEMAFAWLALAQGDLSPAQAHLEAALSLAETSGDPGAMQILAMQLRSPFQCLPQGMALMERLGRLIEGQVPDQLHPWRANLSGLEACLQFWRGHLAPALEAAEQARSMSEALGGLSWLMVDVDPLLAQLYFLQEDWVGVESAFPRLVTRAHEYPAWRAALLFPYALTLWSQGRLDEAGQLYVQMHPSGQSHEWPVGPVLRPMLRGLLEIADRNYARAEQTLAQAVALQQDIPVSTMFNARLLLAYLYYTWGQAERALHELAPILADHERLGAPGLILSHGSAIVRPLLELALKHKLHSKFAGVLRETLQGIGAPRSIQVPDTGALLTPREVEVLRLLVTGASNKTIAETLVVSLPTVKTHISRILDKLGVETRSAAAARARELRLI
jgi:LuxR family maltose regulon positive regulatory protein